MIFLGGEMFRVGKLFEQFCLLFCLYIISYQLIIYIWGSQGLIAHSELLQNQQSLQVHYSELEKRQRELRTLSELVSSDISYISIEARNLGYYKSSDKLILVNTWSQAQPAPSPGNQLIPDLQTLEANTPSGIWFYSLLLGICFWLIIRLLSFGRSDSMPREFSLNSREKFPKLQHAQTVNTKRQTRRRDKMQNLKTPNETTSSPASRTRAGNLVPAPYFPDPPGEENFETLYRQ